MDNHIPKKANCEQQQANLEALGWGAETRVQFPWEEPEQAGFGFKIYCRAEHVGHLAGDAELYEMYQ